ncbi:cytochrome-b5 reductase [Penicillium cf. griseofulvum]|uniref:Cytochrome-b5 reductase n=1 Tax=Penicillium cf. griseofulvum TaxID=2972120 RepID=A0A9W9MZX8_9EURO|nr:cytochrome-b5 reductase [Penicillium cf. griseofulvum]KAJ5421894.1 cytochrome-b5 reductase [Penicillium cf. griseofulvum]KAJ5428085.1 cytochrome-b5 reductase [Penicillium cf. griseofulvum]
MSKYFTSEEVSKHNTQGLKGISTLSFMRDGGKGVLLEFAGSDGTEAFEDVGNSDEAREILAGLIVGNINYSVHGPARNSPDIKKPDL